MLPEPSRGVVDHCVERAWLFEQVRRSRYDQQLVLGMKMALRDPVQLDHRQVPAAHDQQRWRADMRERGRTRQIRPATRETMAAMRASGPDAPSRAAPAPVLAPK